MTASNEPTGGLQDSWLVQAIEYVPTELRSGIIIALVSLALVWIKSMTSTLTKKLETVETVSREAKEQVVNSHSTNLRDDLDGVHNDVREVLSVLERHGVVLDGHGQRLSAHSEQLGAVRNDLSIERQERMNLGRWVGTQFDHVATTAASGAAASVAAVVGSGDKENK